MSAGGSLANHRPFLFPLARLSLIARAGTRAVTDLTRDLDNISFRRAASYRSIGRIIYRLVSRCRGTARAPLM
jgi:hypothetical protein